METLKKSAFEKWYNGEYLGLGSFHTALCNLYILADYSNRKQLRDAFPDFFNKEEII